MYAANLFSVQFSSRKLRGVNLYTAATGGPARAHSLNRFWSMFMSYVRGDRGVDIRMVMHAHEVSPQLLIRRIRAAKVVPRANSARGHSREPQRTLHSTLEAIMALCPQVLPVSPHTQRGMPAVLIMRHPTCATCHTTTHIKLGDGHPQTHTQS